MRRLVKCVLVATALGAALAASAANAQPPVARPQPPPAPPTTKTTAKPGPATTTSTPAPASPQPATGKSPPAPASPAPATPAASSAAEAPPAASQLNAPVLAGSQYLGSYDAGMGQTFYLYGSTQTFAAAVAYYRTVLKDRGELVFEVPPTHMFEVGKFKETEVAFPPGVTVKDYTWDGASGLVNPRLGAAPAFFPTVIQIVPPPPALAGRKN